LSWNCGRARWRTGSQTTQRWTLGRIKTLIGRLFHVSYTPEGVWKLMRRHGWSCQVPGRQALERDEDAVAVWRAEVWPQIKVPRATWAPGSASRIRQARG
jgi:transposase